MNEPVTTSAKIAIFQQLAKSEGTPMTSASENHHSTATKEDSNLQSDSLGYSYFDRGSLTIELNEFYSYLEIPELKLGGHLFETSFTITSNWRECSLEDRSFYISTLLNEVDSCSFAKCRRAAQILLYISLGVFNEAQNTRELLDTMTSNNQLIAENGGLQLFFAQIVRNATQIKKSASNFSKYHSKDLRVFLNLVYNMLIFCGTLLEKDCKEPIYLNLSPREVVTELLLDYHKPEAQSYPINKLLLLLWRLLLLNFNKGKFYRENIEEEPNSPCTCKHRSHHYSLRVKDRPRWQLKANLDDIYKFFKKTETKNYDYFNFSSASFTSENMFPLPIQEARSLLKKKLNFSKNNEVTDPQVRAFMDFLSPQLPSFITLLLKIMLASQPNTKSPGSVRILGFLSWGPSKSKSMSSTTPKLIDALRHKEILTKAVSAIFVTLLEHFKQEDLHEYEYLSERIIADNGLLLLIMILKNWRTCIYSNNNIHKMELSYIY